MLNTWQMSVLFMPHGHNRILSITIGDLVHKVSVGGENYHGEGIDGSVVLVQVREHSSDDIGDPWYVRDL